MSPLGPQSVELSANQLIDIIRAGNDDRFFERTQGPSNFVYRLLRDGANSDAMNVDGSVTQVAFRYTVPAGRNFEFCRMTLHIIDGSIRADGFGGLAPLTNGLLLRILKADASLELDPTDGDPLTLHTDFAHLAGVDVVPDTSGVGGAEDTISVRWTVANAGRAMLLTAGQIFEIIVRDNLTGLTHFHTMVQGILR